MQDRNLQRILAVGVKYIPSKHDKKVGFCNTLFGFNCHSTVRSSSDPQIMPLVNAVTIVAVGIVC